ncbi:transposase [Streptomyces collinus]|uniref:transposase n=1 Tax=Streptomyces collinus TaxID=42684 RepID=UPI00340FEF2C
MNDCYAASFGSVGRWSRCAVDRCAVGADRAAAPGPDSEAGWSLRDHREVIDAIAFKFQTGTQWVHLPEKYGNWRAAPAAR